LEEQAVAVIADCLSKERAVEIQQVSLLGFGHCQWVFEGGMPVDAAIESVYEDVDGRTV
jgi:hypothetical protein